MSSDKTTNLALHKWAGTDPVERTEFNDNFVTIDSKIGEHAAQITGKANQSDLTTTNATVALKADKTYVDSKTQSKADVSYVDTKVAAVASGSPKGVYATLADLQSAYPTGTTGIYLVSADGKWYYWNGSLWAAGSIYQASSLSAGSISSTLIASNAVTEGKTNFFTLGKNRFNKTTTTEGYQLSTDGKTLTANAASGVSDYIYVGDCANLYFYRVDKTHRFSTILTGKFYFYDASFNFLSSQSTSSSSPKFATVPANTVYTRISYSLAPTYNLILINGTDSNAIPYEDYQYSFNYATKTASVIAPISDYIDGYSVSSSGGVSTSTGFVISYFRPIKAGKTYYVSKFRHLMLYTSVVNPDTATFVNAYTTQYKFTAPYDGYVRMSIANTDIANWYFYEYSKLLMNFGDSIAHGDGNSYYGYGQMMAETFGMGLINYSLGGATIGLTSGREYPYQNILTQVSDAITAGIVPDVILIDGGTNDSTYGVPLGTITSGFSTTGTDYDKATTLGAMEYIIMSIKIAFPSAKMIFVKAHLMGSKPPALITIENALHEACKKWGVAVANVMDESGLNTYLPVYAQYTQPSVDKPSGDLTHPTDIGYRLFYNPIIRAVISRVSQ